MFIIYRFLIIPLFFILIVKCTITSTSKTDVVDPAASDPNALKRSEDDGQLQPMQKLISLFTETGLSDYMICRISKTLMLDFRASVCE